MSLQLMKSSLTVLRLDKELVVYPLISAFTLSIVSALFIYSAYVSGYINDMIDKADSNGAINEPTLYIIILLFYICSHFVITFFNTALIGSALIRFEGKNPTLKDGLNIALSRLCYIFAWSVLSGTVSFLLKLLEKRSSAVASIIAGILGLAWTVTSFLVIPIFVQEKIYPLAALKRSAELIRRTWSTALVAELGFGLLGFVLFCSGFLILWLFLSIGTDGLIALIFLLVYWGIVWLSLSALSGIVIAGVYKYGATGEVPHGFEEKQLKLAFH